HFSCRSRGFCPSCHAKRLEEWGEWIREELLLDVPLLCAECGGTMKVIAFITDFSMVDRIINHLKLTFVADTLLHRASLIRKS
ncbi:MAG: hypothetical protein NTV82_00105, partial [Candidatus Aminicenantes bacterium]|nr:hypothetical protein [Candidatus Aminicenantes bacterium]